MRRHAVTLTVNGVEAQHEVDPRRTLADFLREDLQLTGTKLGCEHGVCGACTVLLGGEAVRSCLLFAVQADGAEVVTVEGLSSNGDLHPLQQSFADHHALQCGFCTPGFLMSTYALLRETPNPSDEEIVATLGGNICRCTGYQGILRAVHALLPAAAVPGGGNA
jgi:carbon-monoxide dehydrogenase small subunit